MASRPATIQHRIAVLPALGWLWLAVLVVLGVLGFPVRRHHFEAAGIAFGAAMCFYVALPPSGVRSRLPAWRFPSWRVVVAPTVAALCAFFWAINLGPLSDDFVLRQWAMTGDWAGVDWDYFRPLPLALWWIVLAVGEWPALHALNVAIHAINSGLVALIVGGWYGVRAATVSGLVFALLPTSTEAVVWAAGVFDLTSTFFALLAVVMWVGMRGSALRTVALSACCVAALLAKESAIALLPLFAVLSAFACARNGRDVGRQSRVWASVITATALVLFWRALWAPNAIEHIAAFPQDRRALKDLVLRPYAALVAPVSTNVGPAIEAHLLGVIAVVLLFVALICTLPFRRASPGHRFGEAGVVVSLAWVASAALPLLGTLEVSAGLQGGRYLYLAAVGWALFCGVSVVAPTKLSRWVLVALVVLATLYVGAIHERRGAWREAARLRDDLLLQASALVSANRCRTLQISNAPDSIAGAFVFRTGLAEALSAMPYATDGHHCVATWSDGRLVPSPVP